MQKIINTLAILSFVGVGGLIGGGVYVYTQKDAIIEGVTGKLLESVMPDLGGIAGDAIPNMTGPALPSPSSPIPSVGLPPLP